MRHCLLAARDTAASFKPQASSEYKRCSFKLIQNTWGVISCKQSNDPQAKTLLHGNFPRRLACSVKRAACSSMLQAATNVSI